MKNKQTKNTTQTKTVVTRGEVIGGGKEDKVIKYMVIEGGQTFGSEYTTEYTYVTPEICIMLLLIDVTPIIFLKKQKHKTKIKI